jgi:hypothetical protein
MIMTTTSRHTSRIARALALLSLAATGLAGCVTDAPDTRFDNVGSFGWPNEIGATMHYKVTSRTMSNDTVTAEVRAGKAEYEGMYRLDAFTEGGQTTPVRLQVHFRPTEDTLFVENSLKHENGLSAKYALVAPLDRGRTWVADYQTDASGNVTPAMTATIIERYSYWKLEGKGYENVVAVKYVPLGNAAGTDRQEWIRFYAQGVGVILTVKNRYPVSTYPTGAAPEEDDRIVLTETSVAP